MRTNEIPNLHGFRFFAAILVIIYHVESFKLQYFHLPSYSAAPFIYHLGSYAVRFFFVLSGFLITWLLIIEKESAEKIGKNINLRKFYLNRIFRIWPLYYVLVIVVFYVLPNIPLFWVPTYDRNFIVPHNIKRFALYVIFCPNLAMLLHGNVIYLGQLWSLSVEEFFYLFFPVGLYFLKRKNFLAYFIALTILFFLLPGIKILFGGNSSNTDQNMLFWYFQTYNLTPFTLGAIAGYYYFLLKKTPQVKAYIKQIRLVGYMALLISVFVIVAGINFSYLTTSVYSLLFALLIFCLSISDTHIKLLNNPVIIYLGKISYGIYMLHPLAIVICIKLFYFDTGSNLLTSVFLDVIVIVTTLFISAISYRFLEKPFLKLKKMVG